MYKTGVVFLILQTGICFSSLADGNCAEYSGEQSIASECHCSKEKKYEEITTPVSNNYKVFDDLAPLSWTLYLSDIL